MVYEGIFLREGFAEDEEVQFSRPEGEQRNSEHEAGERSHRPTLQNSESTGEIWRASIEAGTSSLTRPGSKDLTVSTKIPSEGESADDSRSPAKQDHRRPLKTGKDKGQAVAVKVLINQDEEAFKEFQHEVNIMRYARVIFFSFFFVELSRILTRVNFTYTRVNFCFFGLD